MLTNTFVLYVSTVLMLWCRLTKRNMRFGFRQHLWMMAQGLMLFGFNYMLVYEASVDITSGLIAVVFSTIIVMNLVLLDASMTKFIGREPIVYDQPVFIPGARKLDLERRFCDSDSTMVHAFPTEEWFTRTGCAIPVATSK